MEYQEFITVSKNDAGMRIDKYLAARDPQHTRSFYQKLIEIGAVRVDNLSVKSSYPVTEGTRISIFYPDPQELSIIPEDIPLSIVYEDDDIIVVNKAKGMVVHPAAGHSHGTLVNALLYHCSGNLSGINGVIRPGIVHRIDKDTTGLLVVCKNDIAHQILAEQWKDHNITRTYQAIIKGILKEDEITINQPIGRDPIDRIKMSVNEKNGKRAVTHVKTLKRFTGNARNGLPAADYSLIDCSLETGRTHQIRVHLAFLGHPILGDTLYGGADKRYPNLVGQSLHAKTLGFIHPVTNEYICFNSELPEYFNQVILSMTEWNVEYTK